MKLCKPCFQNYFHLLYYASMEFILDSLIFISNLPKVAWNGWHIFLVAAKVYNAFFSELTFWTCSAFESCWLRLSLSGAAFLLNFLQYLDLHRTLCTNNANPLCLLKVQESKQQKKVILFFWILMWIFFFPFFYLYVVVTSLTIDHELSIKTILR